MYSDILLTSEQKKTTINRKALVATFVVGAVVGAFAIFATLGRESQPSHSLNVLVEPQQAKLPWKEASGKAGASASAYAEVKVGAKDKVWAVGTDGKLYTQVNGQFETYTALGAEYSGKVVSTTSDPEGNPYIVATTGEVFGHVNNAWVNFGNQAAKKIFFGWDENLYIHTAKEGSKDFDLKAYDEDSKTFTTIEGAASVDASVDAAGTIWGIDANGQVLIGTKLVTGTYQFLHIKEAVARAISIGEDGTLAVVDAATGVVGLLKADRTEAIVDTSGIAAAKISLGVEVMYIVGTNGKPYSITYAI